MPHELRQQETRQLKIEIKSLEKITQVKLQKKDEASDQLLPSLLRVHRCNTAGGRNAPQLERKSTNECENSELATISVTSNKTKLATQTITSIHLTKLT